MKLLSKYEIPELILQFTLYLSFVRNWIIFYLIGFEETTSRRKFSVFGAIGKFQTVLHNKSTKSK